MDPVTTIQLAVKLWDDRARMERTLRDEVPDGICFVPVAVGLCLDHDAELDDNWSFLQGSTPVASDLHGWTVLGYDVADRYLLSGLMNCGYSEQDRADLAGWAKRLNEFGLFERIEDAARFQDLTDRRVPEHAPFFVYRLLADVPEKLIHELSRRQSR